MRRRDFLIAGASSVGVAGFAGCTTSSKQELATLDQLVLRTDTGQVEPIELTLIYAPHNDSTERPIWGTYEVPASGDTRVIENFEGTPGFYSLNAYSQNHGNGEVISFNSYGDAVGRKPLQFEIVVQQSGDLWTNLDETGTDISIPE